MFYRLRIVEDLETRMMKDQSIRDYAFSRGARFQVNTEDSDKFVERSEERNFLDTLMEEIPGFV